MIVDGPERERERYELRAWYIIGKGNVTYM